MAFAGLWEGYKWPDGTVTRSFTIITTNANETVGELRDRMPVILEPEDWPIWLAEVEGDPATLLRPAGDDVLKVWPVSKQDREFAEEQWRRVVGGGWVMAISLPSLPFVSRRACVRDPRAETMVVGSGHRGQSPPERRLSPAASPHAPRHPPS